MAIQSLSGLYERVWVQSVDRSCGRQFEQSAIQNGIKSLGTRIWIWRMLRWARTCWVLSCDSRQIVFSHCGSFGNRMVLLGGGDLHGTSSVALGSKSLCGDGQSRCPRSWSSKNYGNATGMPKSTARQSIQGATYFETRPPGTLVSRSSCRSAELNPYYCFVRWLWWSLESTSKSNAACSRLVLSLCGFSGSAAGKSGDVKTSFASFAVTVETIMGLKEGVDAARKGSMVQCPDQSMFRGLNRRFEGLQSVVRIENIDSGKMSGPHINC